ncbi:DUF3108 domain-containing protein [Crenobacter caeni]|uniref:DUF3108 domain-containing protein n=1 Tax=Crenobacter caeni TaxID=2705474 RepID=A0A6B2KVR9_9NEIS|nr:DUF3108 domain-containing protein [Crenobacter caeni]NDV14238.1 DUF3108 domain-containing protein [Crenobacter caeni]
MKHARPLLIAVALSLAVHLAVFGGGHWRWPDAAQDMAVKPLTAQLRKLELDAQHEVPPARPTVRLTPRQADAALAAARPAPRKAEASAPQAEASAARADTRATSPPGDEAPPFAPAPPAQTAASSIARAAEALDALASAPAAVAAPVAEATAQDDGRIRPATPITAFPDQATLHYHAYYGNIQVGSGLIHWQRQGGRYHLEARVKGLFSPLLRYVSEGRAAGGKLAPERYQAWRDEAPREYARFDREDKRLDFGDKQEASVPLEPGAQDVLSLGFALALAGGEPAAGDTQITTGKKVYGFRLRPSGEADYDTGDGAIRVVLVRAGEGANRNEYWLAPDFANLPVRIVRADEKKTLELRAYRIDIAGSPVWTLPPRKNSHEN